MCVCRRTTEKAANEGRDISSAVQTSMSRMNSCILVLGRHAKSKLLLMEQSKDDRKVYTKSKEKIST